MAEKKAIWSQDGLREMLTKAAIDAARNAIRSDAGTVSLENTSSQSGFNGASSQKVVGGALMVVGTVFGLAFLSQFRAAGAIPAIIGFVFVSVGYCIAAYRDRFTVQVDSRTWSREKGLFPFAKQEQGHVTDLQGLQTLRATRQRQGDRSAQASSYDVWAARLVWQQTGRAPLDLRPLDLPTDYVDFETARSVHREYADRARLPLIDEAPSATNDSVASAGAAQPVSAPSAATAAGAPWPGLPPRYADSRISASAARDGTVRIVIPGRLNPVTLLFPLVPLVGMGWFLWSVDAQRRDFLAQQPPQARAFFAESGSPVMFFLPFVLIFSLLSIAMFLYTLWRASSRSELVVNSESVTTFRSGWGRVSGMVTAPLSELTDVRAVNRPTGRASVHINGFGVDATPGNGIARTVVATGPRRADLSLGGEELSEPDFEWYLQAVRGLIDTATRAAARADIEKPTSDQRSPAAPGQRPLWKRPGIVFPAVVGVTLANSYAGGLAVVENWTDAAGTRFVRWHSLWRSGGYAHAGDGRETSAEAAYTPFSSYTSGTLPDSVGSSADHRWRVDLTGSAVAEMRRAKQDYATARAAERARLRAQRAADAARLEAALPPAPDAAQLNAVGDRYQAIGSWEPAIRYFTLAARAARKPADALYAYTSIATCCYAQERRGEALAALRSALAIPNLPARDHQTVAAQLKHVEGVHGSLHKALLRIPGDHFPGEEP